MRCDVVTDKTAPKTCEVAQVAQVNENGKPVTVLTMAFAKQPADAAAKAKGGKEQLLFTALAPLNVFLGAGITFKFDGKDMPVMAYRNCNQAGCWSQVLVNAQEVNNIYAKAKTAQASMKLMNGQDLNLNFSVNGLSAALAELNKQLAK